MHCPQGSVSFKRADVLDIYVVFRGQLANCCQWQHTISLMCKLSLLPCSWCWIPTRPVSCSSVCLWGGRSAKTLRSRCVCNKRWGTGFMGSTRDGLALQILGKWRASSSYLRWHSPACRNKGQRRELDSSNDAISPSVTGLALIRVSQDDIWVHHESLNWRRPFTRPQWQILLPSYCAGAQMTVNMQRWPALCASYCLLQACVWIISLIHLVIDWSFCLLLSIPDGSRWQFLRVLKSWNGSIHFPACCFSMCNGFHSAFLVYNSL